MTSFWFVDGTQAIAWTNAELSCNVLCGIHRRQIQQEVHMN